MKDINKDKLLQARCLEFLLLEKEREGERECVYIFSFFVESQMKEVSWMSDRGMIRNERLNHPSESSRKRVKFS